MALFAVLPEFILMHIRMAVHAVCELNSGELLEGNAGLLGNWMTLDTRHFLVHPCQRESRLCMREFYGGLEGINPVAVGAGGGECLLVIIRMTGQAGGIQSEVGKFLFFDTGVSDELCLMAILALLFRMCPGKRETCKRMVEC